MDCDYNDLQTAINSSIVDTEIRVNSDFDITSNIVIFRDQISALKGAYSDCSEDSDTGPNTNIHDVTGNALTIFIDDVLYPTFLLSGFDIHDNSDYGLNIANLDASNNFIMTIENMKIFNNLKTGVNITGAGTDVNINNTSIYNNQNLVGGSTQGGGLRCIDAKVVLLEQTAIQNNQSDLGAGIYAIRCDLSLYAGQYDAHNAIEHGIFGNIAAVSGGGLYLIESIVNASGNVSHPFILSENSATSVAGNSGGGAFTINQNSTINLTNALIENNTTSRFGAAILGTYSPSVDNVPAIINIKRLHQGCNYATYCSSVSNNTSTPGGFSGSLFDGTGDLNISQTIIKNNKSDSALIYLKTSTKNSDINFEGNFIVENTALDGVNNSQFLIYSVGESNSININFTTIANNKSWDIFTLDYNNSHAQTLNVYNSIINNPGSLIVNTLSGLIDDHNASIECSLLHDMSTQGIEDINTFVADPLFIDGYNLGINSTAKDSDCTSFNPPINTDIIGNFRNLNNKADLGAIEYFLRELIFMNGFE